MYMTGLHIKITFFFFNFVLPYVSLALQTHYKITNYSTNAEIQENLGMKHKIVMNIQLGV